ncbi:MAG: lysozyme inhibitor LprI family protein [Acidobacteriaceae bacterium]
MRERSKEILDVKSRSSQSHVYISFRLKLLIERWEEAKKNGGYEANHLHRETDFYIIRAVTCLEVFTRGQIAELVDHERRYTDRAVDLSKNFKMDFALVRDVQGRAITLGDIIAHSVPINRFGQIIEYFETLLGKPLLPLLARAVNRWQVEVMKQPSKPIVADMDALGRCMTRLFEIRHIVCHEIPSDPVYEVSEIPTLLDYALQFCDALEEVLQFEKFGLTPLTQTEMNASAHESLVANEGKLAGLLSVMRDRLRASAVAAPGRARRSTETWTECLDDAQEKWLAYRNAHCEFTAYSSRGGTIWPLLWSTQANDLTQSRIEDLESWITRHEKNF